MPAEAITGRAPDKRSQARSLLSGGAAVLLISSLGQIIVLLAQWTVVRVLGTEQFGILTYVRTWIGLLLIVAVAGIDTALVRFLPDLSSRVPDQALGIIRFATRRTFIFSVGVGGILAAGLFVFGASNQIQYEYFVGALLLLAWAQHQVRHSALSGLDMVLRATVLTSVVRPVVWLALIVAVSRFVALDGAAGLALLAVAFVVTGLVGELTVRKTFRAVKPDEPAQEREIWWRTSVPLALVSSMRVLMTRTDILIIGVVLGTTEAAVYSVASRFALLMALGQSASTAVVSPRLAGLHAKGETASMEAVGVLAARVASVSVVVAFLGSFVFAGPMLRLFGPEFAAGRNVFLILTVGQILNSMAGPVGAALNMTGNQQANAKILAAVVVLNLVLNVPATLRYGVEGAAVVTAFVVSLKNFVTWVVVRRRLGIDLSAFSSASMKAIR